MVKIQFKIYSCLLSDVCLIPSLLVFSKYCNAECPYGNASFPSFSFQPMKGSENYSMQQNILISHRLYAFQSFSIEKIKQKTHAWKTKQLVRDNLKGNVGSLAVLCRFTRSKLFRVI